MPPMMHGTTGGGMSRYVSLPPSLPLSLSCLDANERTGDWAPQSCLQGTTLTVECVHVCRLYVSSAIADKEAEHAREIQAALKQAFDEIDEDGGCVALLHVLLWRWPH